MEKYSNIYILDQFNAIRMPCSSCSSEGQLASRTGFFRYFREREVVVRKWNSFVETFDPEITDEEELNRFIQNKKELDRYCGAFPYDRCVSCNS